MLKLFHKTLTLTFLLLFSANLVSSTSSLEGSETDDENISRHRKKCKKDEIQTSGPLALQAWEESFAEKVAVLGFDYFLASRIIASSMQTLDPLLLVTGATIGFLGADMASGLIHGLGDELTEDELTTKNRSSCSRIFTEIKKNLFRGSHMHHEHPWILKEMSYWEKTRGYNILLAPILLATTFYLDGFDAFTLACWGISLANCEVFHSIAHDQWKGTPVIEELKKKGFILNKKRHNVHHIGDKKRGIPRFKYNFCLLQGTVMDNVVNPIFSLARLVRKWCGPRTTQVDNE